MEVAQKMNIDRSSINRFMKFEAGKTKSKNKLQFEISR